MSKMKVLFYARPVEPQDWKEAIIAAFRDVHSFRVFGPNASLKEQFGWAEVIVDFGGWGSRAMIDAATGVKLWQIVGTGLDHAEVAYMKQRGITVANCPGQFSSVGLAECAMMYILMLTRRWHEVNANFQRGILYRPSGRTLQDLRLGIIGFGASGQDLARRARGFGMRIEAIDVVRPDAAIMAELQPEFFGGPDQMDEVIRRADVLSLHLHLNEKTRHIMDTRRIGLMKPTACLINVARGALVDEKALFKALLEGRLGGVGLDVFAQEPPDLPPEVLQLPNAILTPHIAGVTDDTLKKRIQAALENANRVARGEEPLYQV